MKIEIVVFPSGKLLKVLSQNCSERNYKYLEVGMIDTRVL